jgi:hypothetical protein
MRTRFVSRMGVVGGLAWIAVAMIGLMVQPAAAARSLDLTRPIEPSAQPAIVVTDTRWLDLITSIAPQHRSSAGTLTLHLHLTDQIAAGQVATGGMVYISITRGSQVVGYLPPARPFPAGGSFTYVAALPCTGSMTAPQGGGLPYCNTLQPGDVVWVNQAGSTISLTVPALTALADAPADEVYGVAPISQSVTAYLYPFTSPDTPYTQTVQADAEGNYRASFTPTLDMRARDSGYVMYSAALDRAVYVRLVAPQLRVLVGGVEVSGYAAPNALVLITATQANGTPHASAAAYAALDGRFIAELIGPAAIAIQPNEHIVATAASQMMSMTVMTLTTHIDLANGRVSGETLPNQPIEVERFTGPLVDSPVLSTAQTPIEHTTITATASGQYTAALALARSNFGLVSLTQLDGHQTTAQFVVPYLNVRLGDSRAETDFYAVAGQIGEVWTPITLTIQGTSGYAKDVRHVTTGWTGYFYDAASALWLATGDVLTVTSPHGVQAVFVAPELTGQIDPETDVISGTASPNALVTLLLNAYQLPIAAGGGYPSYYYGYTAIVTANAQGRYRVDLHGVIDLNWYSTGEARVTTSDGHRATRALDALPAAACLARLDNVAVNGDLIRLLVTGNCQARGQVVLRLRAPNGQLKAERTFGWYGFPGSLGFSTALAVVSRDTIELTWSDWAAPPTPDLTTTPSAIRAARPVQSSEQFQSYTVPTLTAQLDLNANMIKGEAPANATLSVEILSTVIYGHTTPVDAQGHYTFSVNDTPRLMAGDRAWVSWYDLGVQWYAYGVAPLLKVTVGSYLIELRQPPLTPLTLTVRLQSGLQSTYAGQTTYDGLLNVYAPNLQPIGVGDRLILTASQTVTTLIVPDLVAQIDRATATLYGRAPAGSQLRVDLTSPARTQWITATASSHYTATFADLAPLTSITGTLTYFEGEAKQVVMGFSTGRWTVTLGKHCTGGVAEMSGKALTVTLESPPGTAREVVTQPVGYGNQFTVCFNRRIETGDRLVLAYSSGVSSLFTLPTLTARHDYAQQAVLGQAPAGSQIEVTANDGAVVRHVWSEANGAYGADLSDRLLPIGTPGQVSVTDAAGNIILRRFTVIGLTCYLPVIVK